MKRVVITGATSFLGKAIIAQLLEQNCRVFALIRPSSMFSDLFFNVSGVTTVLAEMGNTDEWVPVINNADCFLHFGWDGRGPEGRANEEIQRKNIEDALECLRAASRLGCKKFLFAGSQAEYGLMHEPISEESPCSPVTQYGKAKYEVWKQASKLSEELEICYYHTRIFSVYGPGDHPYALVPNCIRTLTEGKIMLLSDCEQYWNYLHITDAARMIIQLLFSGAPAGVYNVAGLDTRKLKEFVFDIHQLCGFAGELRFGERVSSEAPPNLQPDISKILAMIPSFKFVSFKHAISCMIEDSVTMEGNG